MVTTRSRAALKQITPPVVSPRKGSLRSSTSNTAEASILEATQSLKHLMDSFDSSSNMASQVTASVVSAEDGQTAFGSNDLIEVGHIVSGPSTAPVATDSHEMVMDLDANHGSITRLNATGLPTVAVPEAGTYMSIANSLPTITVPKAGTLMSMATEVLQHIVSYLPTDRDIINFEKACKGTQKAVSASIWRERFLRRFDPITDSTVEVADEYKLRVWLSKYYLSYTALAADNLHDVALNLIRKVILDSDGKMTTDSNGNDVFHCPNHHYLFQYFGLRGPGGTKRGSDLLDCLCRLKKLMHFDENGRIITKFTTGGLAMVIQLTLLHLVLDPEINLSVPSSYHVSQRVVYRCYREEPLLKERGRELNLKYFINLANFLKFHLKANNGEGLVAHIYRDTPRLELPQPWLGRLNGDTQELGRYWRGFYLMLYPHELIKFRSGVASDLPVDHVDHNFQDLTFLFNIRGHELLRYPRLEYYDKIGEKPAGGHRHSDGSTKIPEVMEFFGKGSDPMARYFIHGRTYAIPPQEGIPGFQRVMWILELPNSDGYFGLHTSTHWLYDGMVMPGGRIILGRWIDVGRDPINIPHGRSWSGPFMYWNLNRNDDAEHLTVDAAADFMEEVRSFYET